MKKGKILDTILFAQSKSGSNDAFLKIYDIYVAQIYRFVFFKVNTKEEAEDITSSTFLKTWNYLKEGNKIEEKTAKALLYKIARNTVIDHYRKKYQTFSLSGYENNQIDIIDDRHDIHKSVETNFDAGLVIKKLVLLKDEYREVIIMKYIDELSNSEIAEILGKTKGNIRILAHRAINALKEIVNKDED